MRRTSDGHPPARLPHGQSTTFDVFRWCNLHHRAGVAVSCVYNMYLPVGLDATLATGQAVRCASEPRSQHYQREQSVNVRLSATNNHLSRPPTSRLVPLMLLNNARRLDISHSRRVVNRSTVGADAGRVSNKISAVTRGYASQRANSAECKRAVIFVVRLW